MENDTSLPYCNSSNQVAISRINVTKECLDTIGNQLRKAMRDIILAGPKVHPEVSLPLLQALQNAMDAHEQATTQTEFLLVDLKPFMQAP